MKPEKRCEGNVSNKMNFSMFIYFRFVYFSIESHEKESITYKCARPHGDGKSTNDQIIRKESEKKEKKLYIHSVIVRFGTK